MTDIHHDPEFNERALALQNEIAHRASLFVRALEELGYDIIVLRLSKIIRSEKDPTQCAMPGASVTYINPTAAPCLMVEAGEMRHVAERMEAKFREIAPKTEADYGYTEEVDPAKFGL